MTVSGPQKQAGWGWAPALAFPGHAAFGGLLILSSLVESISFQRENARLHVCHVLDAGEILVKGRGTHPCAPDTWL